MSKAAGPCVADALEDVGPWSGPSLGRSFYARDAETVARALLGAVIRHRIGCEVRCARVIETEAYVGPHDRASHASRGRTRRTEVMFGPPGHAYVYFVYGMHTMLNVVTGAVGDPQAVLIRGGEPLEGLCERLDGPGRFARGLRITLADNGMDLVTSDLRFYRGTAPTRVLATPRVGVEYAGEWAQAPLRFFDADSGAVSADPRRGADGRGWRRPRPPAAERQPQPTRRCGQGERKSSWTSGC